MVSEAIAFAFEVFISACCLYVAAQIALENVRLASLAGIVVAVALVSLIPVVGWIASLVLFVTLLYYVTETPLEGCIWIVLISKLISFVSVQVLQTLIA